jgi:uncharacterized damage-inducible protein DinB
MFRRLAVTLALAAMVPAAAQAQDTPRADSPLVASTGILYSQVKGWIGRAAEQVPEEQYAFRPTDGVRTFRELLGHIANAHYLFCSAALGEASPATENFEETRTTKAAMQEALRASFDYCDRAYSSITDAQATDIVQVFGADRPRLFALNFNVAHDMEHYGNIVTYMRINGLVPPSSQR